MQISVNRRKSTLFIQEKTDDFCLWQKSALIILIHRRDYSIIIVTLLHHRRSPFPRLGKVQRSDITAEALAKVVEAEGYKVI